MADQRQRRHPKHRPRCGWPGTVGQQAHCVSRGGRPRACVSGSVGLSWSALHARGALVTSHPSSPLRHQKRRQRERQLGRYPPPSVTSVPTHILYRAYHRRHTRRHQSGTVRPMSIVLASAMQYSLYCQRDERGRLRENDDLSTLWCCVRLLLSEGGVCLRARWCDTRGSKEKTPRPAEAGIMSSNDNKAGAILSNVSGEFLPGELTAIMGMSPSALGSQ